MVPAVERTTLSNGLRVVTERMPEARSVAVGVWVGVGARDEPEPEAGVSHFLEHLLFKGTDDRSARAIADAVDRVGGEMNAFTAKEYTAYYTRLPATSLPLGLDLLGDVLCHPALRDGDVEAERQVIMEELAMDADTPDDHVHTLLYEALFPGHPLGRETAGHRSTVAALTPDEVRAFHRQWYRPANLVVSVAGAADHDDVVARVEQAFSFAATAGTAPDRKAPADGVRPLSVERRRTEQVHLALGWRGLPRDDAQREALDVANHVLGGGMSSRLFDEIRDKRGLAYSVFSAPAGYRDAGAFTVYAGTAPSQVDEVLDVVDAELDRFVADGITPDEREVAVGYLTGSFVLGLEDPASRMSRHGTQLTVFGALRPVDTQVARYEAVTRADVAKVAERILAGRRSLAVVGPVARKSFIARVA